LNEACASRRRLGSKDLKRLDADTQARILSALERFAATGEGDSKGSSKLDVDVEGVNSLRNGPTPVVAVAHSRAAEELWWARENSNL
jgi:hypothetical protein